MTTTRRADEMKSVLRAVAEQVKSEYKAEIIGVFGSYARGEQRKGGDLDVLVRFREGATLFDLVGLGDFLEERLGLPVDVVPIDAIRKEIKDAVIREAVYL